jgi:hypothetical protein
MNRDEPGGPSPSGAVGEVGGAFGKHTRATGWPWDVSITPLAQSAGERSGRNPAAVRIDLSLQDAEELADLLIDAAERADSPHSGDLLGTARVAKMLAVTQSTIRGWVTRDGPKANPFPQPDRSDSGRNFWHKRTITSWRARQRRIDQQRRRDR